MALKLTNFATSTLAAPVTDSDTTISVQSADASKFPSVGPGDWAPIVIVKATGEREVLRCTGRTGAVLNVDRGQEGTSAQAFSAGDRVDCRLTAGAMAALPEIAAIAAALAALLPLTGGTLSGLLTLSGDPTNGLHAATKQYVDGLAANVGKRGAVRVATTANIDLSAPGAAIDGVTLSAGDLILAKNQSTPAQNGIYVFAGAAVAATRDPQFDSYNEHAGAMLTVQEGTANADTLWLCTANRGGTLGSTAITWSTVPIVVAATTLLAGILRLATDAETIALVATNLGVTPAGLAALLGNKGFLQAGVASQVVAGGAEVTFLDHGNVSSGTRTIDVSAAQGQTYSNRGAHSLACSAKYGWCVLDIVNGSGAGAITPSGFAKVSGPAFDTTVGHAWRCTIRNGPAGKELNKVALF